MLSKLKKLTKSLSKTRDSIFGKIGQVIGGRKIDDDLLDEIEEILLKSDIGIGASEKIIDSLRTQAKQEKISTADEVFDLLKKEMSSILEKGKQSISETEQKKLTVWLITGVNGTGKTTLIRSVNAIFEDINF